MKPRRLIFGSLVPVVVVLLPVILAVSGSNSPADDVSRAPNLSGESALTPLTTMGGGVGAPTPVTVSSERFDPDAVDGPGRTHRIYFPNTDHELHIYHILGREPGTTMLIIGGIHGNEPGGYLAADLYADLSLRRGNLIVVPRANIQAIHQNARGNEGDLNRRFGGYDNGHIDREIAIILEELMAQADVLLNLHDGSGFYSPVEEGLRRNPRLWGQSVIIDTESFTTSDGKRCDLLGTAGEAVRLVNHLITDAGHQFRIKNTLTFDENSSHREQRGSATFYAVSEVGIPGFGVETSQDIMLESQRVRYQVLVINAFMEAFDIVPDHPRFALETPVLGYLAVSIDGGPSLIVENGGSLNLAPGSTIEITHIEANYERGILVDIEGEGGFNDLGLAFRIERDTRVTVSKDKYPCGSVLLIADPSLTGIPAPATRPAGESSPIVIEAFRIAQEGRWTWLQPDETLKVLWGDELLLDDPLAAPTEGFKINFRGFVGNQRRNDGEDRGYPINTAHDLLQRFSLSPDSERYEIRAELNGIIFARSFVEIVIPRLEYVLIQPGYGPLLALAEGDTLNLGSTSSLKVIELVTLPRESGPLTVDWRGSGETGGSRDRESELQLGDDLLKDRPLPGGGGLHEITVRRKGLPIGTVLVRFSGPDGGQR